MALFRSVEQANFAKIVAAHLNTRDGPLLLEGGTGIGKTRVYLSALIASDRRVALVLPTHQLIDQLLNSSDLTQANTAGVSVAAFRPSRFFETRAEYEINRGVAQQAQIMLCTSASVIIDQRLGGSYNGAIGRDYLVFDEADQLPSAAALQRNMEVPGAIIEGLGIKGETAKELAEAVVSSKNAGPEHRAAAKLILEALDDPAWYQKAGKSDDGGITLWHVLPGRLLKRVANRPDVAFISATLTIGGRFDDFRHALGITAASRLSGVIEADRHGDVSFHVAGGSPVNEPGWMEAVVSTITKAEAPVLVVPASFDVATKIGEAVEGCVVRQREEKISDALVRFASAKVLVATAAWAGLDTPIQWKSIVVPTVPCERPTIVDDKIESRYIDGRNTAVRRLRQVIGRGLRSPDANCAVYFLDPRVTNLPPFWPARFATAWNQRADASGAIEGMRVEVVLSKAERDPSNRKRALAHYGLQCQSCGLRGIAQQIEVHHLDPVSEGVRQTKLEDLRPLCRNCHALAHSRNPPAPIEELRQMTALSHDRLSGTRRTAGP